MMGKMTDKMTRTLTLAPLLLALTGVAAPAMARDHDRDRDRHRDRHGYSQSRGGDHHDWGGDRGRGWNRSRDGRRWSDRDRDGRWRHESLYRPNHGYRWVHDDHGNFLLVAAATGIITSILMSQAY